MQKLISNVRLQRILRASIKLKLDLEPLEVNNRRKKEWI